LKSASQRAFLPPSPMTRSSAIKLCTLSVIRTRHLSVLRGVHANTNKNFLARFLVIPLHERVNGRNRNLLNA
jgi:hypothetical protein